MYHIVFVVLLFWFFVTVVVVVVVTNRLEMNLVGLTSVDGAIRDI